MYYASKTEYQCFDSKGKHVGVAFDLHQVADLAGEGGLGVIEMKVGEITYKVRNGIAERSR